MDEAAIRDRVRRLIEEAVIPCDKAEQLWAGHGAGHQCVVCDSVIERFEVEFEVQLGGRTLRVHRRCHAIWQEECAPVMGC